MEGPGIISGNTGANSLVSNNTAALASSAVDKVDQQLKPEQQVQPVNDVKEQSLDPKQQEQARFEAVKRTAKEVSFVVSDHRFTIFRDAATGEFITRFTSLRDGSVTIVPEQRLIAGGSNGGSMLEALV